MNDLASYNCIDAKYFLDYELINKYNSGNLYYTPKIESITGLLSIIDILNASVNLANSIKTLEVKLYFILYTLFLKTPLLQINPLALSKKGKATSFSYYLKFILIDSISISEFFISVFFENWYKIIKEEPLIKNSKNIDIKTSFNNIFYNFKISIGNFSSFIKLSYIFNLICDFKETFFSITLRLNYSVKILKFSAIRNFPFFWIND